MKVYELVAELMKRPAGDEVLLSARGCNNAHAVSVEIPDEGLVLIAAEELMVVADDGTELGTTSEFSANARSVDV